MGRPEPRERVTAPPSWEHVRWLLIGIPPMKTRSPANDQQASVPGLVFGSQG